MVAIRPTEQNPNTIWARGYPVEIDRFGDRPPTLHQPMDFHDVAISADDTRRISRERTEVVGTDEAKDKNQGITILTNRAGCDTIRA